ncbi:uncharacterized protein LOC130667321 [Microplitis mediator]|uniref:uncharacterized protein LOC130667321 n=1 Tax=Microplitis mediator TaxID=375433 RepID=UPI0025564360|nr:uncharacterized protein LOC130667321 [Microplitis mediator]
MYAFVAEEIAALRKQLALLTAEVNEMLTQEQLPNTRSRAHRHHRPRKVKKFDYCWYHSKFGENARACASGCKWQGNATGTEFLVDTGSDLSVFPRGSMKSQTTPIGCQLYAANGTIIETYGLSLQTLNFGLRRDFTWNFIVADVTKPILGADFLSHFDLLVDLKRKCLRDGITGLTSSGYFHVTTAFDKIKAVGGDSIYMKLLREFAEITRPDPSINEKRKHSTVHYIRTIPGLPVSSEARRLSPDKLKIAQEECRKTIEQGICRPSQSAWSSPLHMVH